MHAAVALIILICFIGGVKTEVKPVKGEMNITVAENTPLRLREVIVPNSEFLNKNILKQEHDFSCGSAALGTLLNYCLGESFTEKQIISGMLEYGDKAQIKKLRAFSLWDMQRFVDAIGYKSGGFNAELNDLKDPEQWPCIVPIELMGYRHFVVLKGIHKDHVIVADPWRGNGSYTLKQFEKIWYKNILYKIFSDDGCLPNLKMKESDMRFIDQDMEKSLMFDVEQAFNIPGEIKVDFHYGTSQRYKR